MLIQYRKNGMLLSTDSSNADLEIISQDGNRFLSVFAKEEIELVSAEQFLEHPFDRNDTFFVNGYQSWTSTKEFRFQEALRDVTRIPSFLNQQYAFTAYGDSFIVNTRKDVLHGFDFAYVKGQHPLFIGSLNYQNAYLIIAFEKKEHRIGLIADVAGKHLSQGEQFCIFHYLVHPDPEEGMRSYFALLTARTQRKLFGYTSWYNHYQNISEEIILHALEEADPRFELFQIDDGFEPFVGDWLEIDSKKFPHGLSPIVKRIHEKQMLAGIWLAPFAVESDSRLFHEHPEYLLTDDHGPICCGGNWSKFYGLDLSKPEVQQYVRKVLQFYLDMGFDFFKLDFLYAASKKALPGKTHAETAETAYSLLREVLGDKLILGCGATLSNTYGKFDYLRIGPDVSLKFDDVLYMRLMHRERISTKTTLLNTIFRFPMNGHAFLNDPDVFLLRDDNLSLSKKQRESLLLINSLFGSLLMTSDNPKEYDDKKKQLLEEGLDRFRNAEVQSFELQGNQVAVTYTLHGTSRHFHYHTRTGETTHG